MQQQTGAVGQWLGRAAVGLLLLTAARLLAAGDGALLTWYDPEGRPVRFADLEELESFYRTAAVLDRQVLSEGITGSEKLVLEREGTRLHAHFQAVDRMRDRARTARGAVELAARDSYRYNVAAYRLSRVLGMDNVPPSFERSVERRDGAITAWVENAFTERERLERGTKPPDPQRWSRQVARLRVFDELIANVDRNQGNILIDRDWKIWLIDHTRAFRPRRRLEDADVISSCDRSLWTALTSVSDEDLGEAVRPWLTKGESKALLERRAALVVHLRQLIETRGEAAVIHEL